jgi:site-specific recombinase XerD
LSTNLSPWKPGAPIEGLWQISSSSLGKAPDGSRASGRARWRDHLRSGRKRAATVSFKLSLNRFFFKYLIKAGGVIPLNPASTKLVTPPELPTEPAGRALTSKEVRHLLTSPDREKPEGARDYALVLVMLRLSMPVAEVCSLCASSVK